MALVPFETSKKTYAVIVAALALGVADKFGVEIPWYVSWGLKLLGQADLLAAIRAESRKSADDIVELVKDIVTQVTTPSPPPLNPNVDVTGATVLTVPVEVRQLDPIGGNH